MNDDTKVFVNFAMMTLAGWFLFCTNLGFSIFCTLFAIIVFVSIVTLPLVLLLLATGVIGFSLFGRK